MSSTTVALLYPGDRAARDRSDPAESRFAALFDAFARAGVAAVPAIYHDDFGDEVERQLRDAAVVLVWCNPIEGGRRRDRLDAMLRRIADAGVFVSAHPDTILALGTKDVLVATRDLPFGSDVERVDSVAQLAEELPARLRRGPRVLKQFRGHSGIGVWRVELAGERLHVRHAQRGSEEALMGLPSLLTLLAPYFEAANGGHMIDQAWQPGLARGMVRAYLVGDRVAGFGFQQVNALFPPHLASRRRNPARGCTTARNYPHSAACRNCSRPGGSSCCAPARACHASACRCCGTATSCSGRPPTSASCCARST